MRYRHRVLALLFLLSIITYLDRVCIAVAGPRMQADLNMTPEQWGWVTGIFALSYAAFEIPSGAMGDRIGPRRVLTRIVIWWSAFTTFTGFARSYLHLLPIRFLFGAGEAGAYPNSSSSIAKWFPVAERARAHGIVWMASRIGGAVSPLLVIPIQRAYGWRASFYVFGIAGLVWAAVWYTWYRDRPSEKPGVSLREAEEIGPEPPRGAHGLPWGIALGSRNLWTIMLMYCTYCYGSFFFLSWLQTYLVKGRGFTETGLMLSTLPFILGALANLGGGFTSDAMVRKFGLKNGRRTVAIFGLGCAALFTVATILTKDKYVALVFLALSYAGSDFMLPTAWAVCLDVGKKYAGAVTGAMNTAGQIGSTISSVLFGYLVTYAGGDYNFPLIPMTVMLTVSALLWLKIDPTEQLIPEGEEQAARRVKVA
ncbi:MAG: MFS transporter [Candidatus Solibacter usitatus]|nr:MFS transporter [Candidatus Solibacter usitatus]